MDLTQAVATWRDSARDAETPLQTIPAIYCLDEPQFVPPEMLDYQLKKDMWDVVRRMPHEWRHGSVWRAARDATLMAVFKRAFVVANPALAASIYASCTHLDSGLGFAPVLSTTLGFIVSLALLSPVPGQEFNTDTAYAFLVGFLSNPSTFPSAHSDLLDNVLRSYDPPMYKTVPGLQIMMMASEVTGKPIDLMLRPMARWGINGFPLGFKEKARRLHRLPGVTVKTTSRATLKMLTAPTPVFLGRAPKAISAARIFERVEWLTEHGSQAYDNTGLFAGKYSYLEPVWQRRMLLLMIALDNSGIPFNPVITENLIDVMSELWWREASQLQPI